MKRLYFDHNATCPMRPAALAAVMDVLSDAPTGNPSSAHADGRRARARLEAARERLARVFACHRDELVFTSGGTESNNLALQAAGPEDAVLFAPIEHPSLLVPLRHRRHVRALRLDDRGHVIPDDIARDNDATATARVALVTVALANHEIGVVQDLPRIVSAAHALGARVHCDASQAAGKWPLSFRALGVDLLTVSAHKLGGPVGIGALIVRAGTLVPPLLHGGEQEAGLRAGTEAVALAAGFAAAAEDALAALPAALAQWRTWHDELRVELTRLDASVVFHSPERDGLPNTLNASFPGRPGAALVHRLDLEGVSVSHGSACATGSLQPSPVLLALGVGEELARSAVRFSLGHVNTHDDITELPTRLGRALDAVVPRRVC